MTLKTLGMGIIMKSGSKKAADKAMKEAQKKFKIVLDKKKGKDLDWSDLSKSYKIFTKK
jgi:hypothetical protein